MLEKVFAAGYDRVMAGTENAGLHEWRGELLAAATGDVLEIGAGTGANSDFYSDAWTSLTLTEPSRPMAQKLRRKLADRGLDAEVIEAGGEQLPLPDESVDTVISTLVLCTVGDLDATLAEVRRVLRPGGRLLFLEHVRNGDDGSARWQDRFHGIWKVVGNGCNCNRSTAEAIERAGLEIEVIDHGKMPKAPPIVRPMIQGAARRPA